MGQVAALMVVLIVFLCLTSLTVGLRMFVRLRLAKSFGIDDVFMALAQASFMLEIALVMISIHYGLGRHVVTLEPENAMLAGKFLVIGEIVYVPCSAFIKISVALLLLRVAVNPVFRYIIHAIIIIVALWSVVTVLLVALQCIPLELSWNPAAGKGTCLSGTQITHIGFAFSALDIGSDCILSFLPVPMLWNVRMTWRIKVLVCSLLSLGIFASVATVIRLKYLVTLIDPTDTIYSICVAQMWTILECGIGITAGSMAALKPLLRALNVRGLENSGPSAEADTVGKNRRKAYQSERMGYLKQEHGVHSASTQVTERDNDSEDFILDPNKIYKNVQYSTHSEVEV